MKVMEDEEDALELPMRLRSRDEPVGAGRSLLQPASPSAPPIPIIISINPAVHADCFLERWVGLADFPTRGTGALLGPPSYTPFWKAMRRTFWRALLRSMVFSAQYVSV